MDDAAIMSGITTNFTTGSLAQRVNGELHGPDDLRIVGVNALVDASVDQITFIGNSEHADQWANAKAGAALVTKGIEPKGHDPTSRALIIVPQAELAMIELLSAFKPQTPDPEPGIHHSASIHSDSIIGKDVCIGPHVSIDRGTRIGDAVILHAGVRIYADVTIGERSVVHANAVLRERCQIGRNVILHQNVSIGADGFGYQPSADGSTILKVPHIGIVVIEDDVEIGANSCVDRGKFQSTRIGKGTKIDNLCQIGHNCQIGTSCIVAGMTAIGGSVSLGDGAMLAGGVRVVDHVKIGKAARIGAGAGVMRDVPDGETHLGAPAGESSAVLRQWAAIRKLPDWMKRISQRLRDEQA